jgi:cation:H+ antiporter
MTLLLLILSVPLMGVSAHFFVDKVVSVAHKLRLPLYGIAAGLVSILTSVPEIIVSLNTAFNHQIELSMGNIWGSVLANTLLVLGVSACFKPLACRPMVARIEMPFLVMALITWGLCIYLDFWTPVAWVAPLFWVIYIVLVHQDDGQELPNVSSTWWDIPWALFYFGLIWLASLWLIDGAQWVANYFQWPHWFVGMTILAIGTSLPELVVTLVALLKGHADLALGNAVGSNVFLVLMLMPICGIVGADQGLSFVLPAVMMSAAANGLLYLFVLFFDTHRQINRWEGALMLLAYALFLWAEYQ